MIHPEQTFLALVHELEAGGKYSQRENSSNPKTTTSKEELPLLSVAELEDDPRFQMIRSYAEDPELLAALASFWQCYGQAQHTDASPPVPQYEYSFTREKNQELNGTITLTYPVVSTETARSALHIFFHWFGTDTTPVWEPSANQWQGPYQREGIWMRLEYQEQGFGEDYGLGYQQIKNAVGRKNPTDQLHSLPFASDQTNGLKTSERYFNDLYTRDIRELLRDLAYVYLYSKSIPSWHGVERQQN